MLTTIVKILLFNLLVGSSQLKVENAILLPEGSRLQIKAVTIGKTHRISSDIMQRLYPTYFTQSEAILFWVLHTKAPSSDIGFTYAFVIDKNANVLKLKRRSERFLTGPPRTQLVEIWELTRPIAIGTPIRLRIALNPSAKEGDSAEFVFPNTENWRQEISQSRKDFDASPQRINDDLALAIRRKNRQDIHKLIRNGARLNNGKLVGFTDLTWAISNRDTALAFYLLEHGADVQIPEVSGRTPLMWAVLTHQSKIVKALLAKGASVKAKDRYGETALSIAREKGYHRLAMLLTKAGKNK